MGMTAAQRQRLYRQRHLKDKAGEAWSQLERINGMVSIAAKCRLLRLARHYGTTQREILERALNEMEQRTLQRLSSRAVDEYYDDQESGRPPKV